MSGLIPPPCLRQEICAHARDGGRKTRLGYEDICDMIAGGDFERHKKLCKEERLRRMSKLCSLGTKAS